MHSHHASEAATDHIVRPRDLPRVVGLSASTIARLRRAGLFVRAIRLSPGRVGYRRSDVEGWLAARQEDGPQ